MPTDLRPILCLDFDGVLHAYTSGWKGADKIPDPPVPGAMAFLRRATEAFCVHVYSSRSHQPGGIDAMQAWLERHMAEHFLEIGIGAGLAEPQITNMAEEFVRTDLTFPTVKPPASVSIDDRCITFTGNWPSIDELKAFKPWNKRP
jgi:hypothetical protein